jgi:ribosomal protein L9
VVGAYKKVEDKFVDQYLTKDGESVEDAKARLKAEQKEREEASAKVVQERAEKAESYRH